MNWKLVCSLTMNTYRSSTLLRSVGPVLSELWRFMFVFSFTDFMSFELLNSKLIWNSEELQIKFEFQYIWWIFVGVIAPFVLRKSVHHCENSFPDFILSCIELWISKLAWNFIMKNCATSLSFNTFSEFLWIIALLLLISS